VFKDFGFSFFTSTKWDAASEDGLIPASYGVAAMLVGSMVIAAIAVFVAVPFAMSVALFLEYYAPQRIKSVLVSILDLIASIPSVIWGIWGYTILMPHAAGWSKSLNHWLGWFPLFKVPAPIFERSPFIAGLLLAMMILPIITSVAREVYSQAPRDQIDAAYGLGASKWGTMRAVVLPFGRGGLVGGTMLGLGRALGETVAVYLVLNLVFKINFQILASVGGNVASLIAGRFGEATPYELKALMAAGLVLFVLTLFVNFIATAIVARSAKGPQ
jgi:phosphate transport system permease protein